MKVYFFFFPWTLLFNWMRTGIEKGRTCQAILDKPIFFLLPRVALRKDSKSNKWIQEWIKETWLKKIQRIDFCYIHPASKTELNKKVTNNCFSEEKTWWESPSRSRILSLSSGGQWVGSELRMHSRQQVDKKVIQPHVQSFILRMGPISLDCSWFPP